MLLVYQANSLLNIEILTPSIHKDNMFEFVSHNQAKEKVVKRKCTCHVVLYHNIEYIVKGEGQNF